MNIWHPKYPETVVLCSITSQKKPRYDLPVPPPPLPIWPIEHSSVFDYTNNPIGHPGTCVVANVKYIECPHWSHHDNPGWYIVPTLEIYNFHSVYMNKTRERQLIDTLDFCQTSKCNVCNLYIKKNFIR